MTKYRIVKVSHNPDYPYRIEQGHEIRRSAGFIDNLFKPEIEWREHPELFKTLQSAKSQAEFLVGCDNRRNNHKVTAPEIIAEYES